jgi:branched-chain amino acid transport system permease protein
MLAIGRRGLFLLGTGVILVMPLALGEGYHLHLLNMALIFIILAASLDLIVGLAGLLSLGHHAFFGLGAYTSALLFLHFRMPMWGGMIAGMIVAALAAFLLGALVLKVRGHRFVITTIAFAEILRLVAYNWVDLTRGQMGLPGIHPPVISLPGVGSIHFASKQTFYYLLLLIASASVMIIVKIARSPLGMGLAAVRENEKLAESVGIDVYRHALTAFTVGASFAGLAGSLYAHYIGFVSPDLFYFSYITIMLVMLVMGGMGTIVGPVFGAIIFTLLPEYLRIARAFQLVLFGGTLIVAILFVPGGLVELWERMHNAVAVMKRKTRADHA